MGSKTSKVEADNAEEKTIQNVMNSNRKCKDVLCILIFVAFWGGMGVCAYFGLTSGDPARLTHGTDYAGNICGSNTHTGCVGGDCTKTPVLHYPRIEQDILASGVDLSDPVALSTIPFYGVCREQCPDGVDDKWVCSNEALNRLSELYGSHANGRVDMPSVRATEVLGECYTEKLSGFFAVLTLSDNHLLSDGATTAPCKFLMENCWRMYVEERSLFYRCVPLQEDNSTCIHSPYLESIGESPSYVQNSDGSVTTRKGSDAQCGECLDPVYDEAGEPMDPGSNLCHAKNVKSSSEVIQAASNPMYDQINGWTMVVQQWMGDVELCQVPILLTGGPIAMVFGVIWLILLRLFAGVFVWASIWGFFISSVVLTIQFFIYGDVIDTNLISSILESTNLTSSVSLSLQSDISTTVTGLDLFGQEVESQTKVYAYAGWFMLIFSTVVFVMILAMWNRIRIAIAIIREATKAIAAMPSILLFPIVTVAMTMCITLYWAYIAMYLSSASSLNEIEAATNSTGRRLDATSLTDLYTVAVDQVQSIDYIQQLWLYHFFGFLWTNQLISAIGCTTIAGAVASWYWASDIEEEKKSKTPKLAVVRAFGRTVRYHVGSLIFGSLIIAIVQFVRAMLMYLDKQTRNLQKSNPLIKVLLKVVHCCLWCFEKVLKYISKNAYILIAIRGSSFCTAAKDSFKLIFLNIARMGTATVISNLMIMLGRLVIVALSALTCGGLIVYQGLSPSSLVIPVVTTILGSWFVSGCFMNVYGLAIDTIMVCFCEDEARNDGSALKPYFMPNSLKKIVNKSNQASKSDDDDGSDDKAKDMAKEVVENKKKGFL